MGERIDLPRHKFTKIKQEKACGTRVAVVWTGPHVFPPWLCRLRLDGRPLVFGDACVSVSFVLLLDCLGFLIILWAYFHGSCVYVFSG